MDGPLPGKEDDSKSVRLRQNLGLGIVKLGASSFLSTNLPVLESTGSPHAAMGLLARSSFF